MVKRGNNVVVLDRTTPVAKLVPYSDDLPDPLVISPALEHASVIATLSFPPVTEMTTDSLTELLKERKERGK